VRRRPRPARGRGLPHLRDHPSLALPPYLRHQSPKVRRASSSLICSCSAGSLELVSRSASLRNRSRSASCAWRPDSTSSAMMRLVLALFARASVRTLRATPAEKVTLCRKDLAELVIQRTYTTLHQPAPAPERNNSGAKGYRFEPYRAYHPVNNLAGPLLPVLSGDKSGTNSRRDDLLPPLWEGGRTGSLPRADAFALKSEWPSRGPTRSIHVSSTTSSSNSRSVKRTGGLQWRSGTGWQVHCDRPGRKRRVPRTRALSTTQPSRAGAAPARVRAFRPPSSRDGTACARGHPSAHRPDQARCARGGSLPSSRPHGRPAPSA
jgi:hypothetical protein